MFLAKKVVTQKNQKKTKKVPVTGFLQNIHKYFAGQNANNYGSFFKKHTKKSYGKNIKNISFCIRWGKN